jgi:hypothetical protein
MAEDLGTPLGHKEIIRRINAQKAAEAGGAGQRSAGQQSYEESAPKRARIRAFRDDTNGQFYAMSREDRAAFNAHCEGIVADLQPVNHRERWLATSIAEDQWRLNRARALESNIFALGMSNPMNDVDIDSAEGHAAICQARTWLADGKQLQMLALYESRIRRSIEKNEKQLKELQTERKAARDKALEEAKLLAQLALSEGEIYVQEENGFGFSSEEIVRLVRREMRLKEAIRRTTKHQKAA